MPLSSLSVSGPDLASDESEPTAHVSDDKFDLSDHDIASDSQPRFHGIALDHLFHCLAIRYQARHPGQGVGYRGGFLAQAYRF